MNKCKTDFLEYLEIERNRSHTTLQNYDFYLQRFINWAKEKKCLHAEQVSLPLVRQYRLWLNRLTDRNGHGLKKNTQNYHLIALRSFLKYLAKRDIATLAPEKIELGKMPERQVEFLEGADLQRLLDAPLKVKQSSTIQKRDKAILETLFSTGLRVSELAGLKREQINLNKEEFTVRGKGSKLRVVFLSEEARRYLKYYLEARHDTHQNMFIRHDRAATPRPRAGQDKIKDEEEAGLTPRSIQRLIEKYAKQAGLTKKITPHTMRHSYATDLLLNGADIRSVQMMLGHSSITTTQIYTHITNQQLRDVHRSFHGKKKKNN